MVMTEANGQPPAESEALHQAIETFRVYSGIVLLSFAKHGQGLRDSVARNVIARGMSCTQSIYAVWRAGSEQDAWILHRALLDRLLHLHHLGETDGFSEFEEFSFLSMYEARHKLLSDADMSAKVPTSLKALQKTDRPRYDSISAKQARWRRPKAEDVAKQMDLGFLYRFGYDYASMHVHPMAISAPHVVTVPDATVVRNSILVQSMLVQEAFNVSKMRWRAIMYDFLDEIRTFIRTSDPQFHGTSYKIGKAWPTLQLCEPVTSSDGA
jgi:Family of unknown function (DUF5677)